MDIQPGYDPVVTYEYGVENERGELQRYQNTWQSERLVYLTNMLPYGEPFTIEYLPDHPGYSLPASRYWHWQTMGEDLSLDLVLNKIMPALGGVIVCILAAFVCLIFLWKASRKRPMKKG